MIPNSTSIRFAFSAALAALAMAAPGIAKADCAAPQMYTQQVTANTVTICPTTSYSGRDCPTAAGMLREDVATHVTVVIPDICGSDGGMSSCYVDECVPPGTYHYGYADPFACGASCGTSYFVEATVAAASGACAVDAGGWKVGTTPWDASIPQGGDNENHSCVYHAYDGGPGPILPPPPADGGTDGHVANSDAGPPPHHDAGPLPSRDAGGDAAPIVIPNEDAGPKTDAGPVIAPPPEPGASCAVVAPIGAQQAALTLHGLGLMLGLGILSRRRRAKK